MSISQERLDELALEVAHKIVGLVCDEHPCGEVTGALERDIILYSRALLAAVESELVPVGYMNKDGEMSKLYSSTATKLISLPLIKEHL